MPWAGIEDAGSQISIPKLLCGKEGQAGGETFGFTASMDQGPMGWETA